MQISIQYFETPFGELVLGAFQENLCLCDWRFRRQRELIDKRIKYYFKSEFVEEENQILTETKNQLSEYFNSQRIKFDLPIGLAGTDFQKSVWNELMNIPFGKTESYLSLSKKLGNSLAIRAVASANGANAISIIVPCHRIIGSNNELIGYAGGLEAKRKLLELEGVNLTRQIKLF